MIRFIDRAQNYAKYHQKKATLYTHLVGVPLIVFGLMIFLGFFQLIIPGVMATTLATIATLSLLVYYFFLNWRLALLLVPILILMLWVSHIISYAGPTSSALWTFVIVFFFGVLLQLIGHMLEGKKPALMDNLSQAMLAPLFLIAEICFMLGLMKVLKEQIHDTPHPLDLA